MNEIDLKIQALANKAVSQSDLNKLILCKLKALEEVLEDHDPNLSKAYALKLYELLQETAFSTQDKLDDAD